MVPIRSRQTEYLNGRLRLTKKDLDHKPYILVTGVMPTFNIVGWLKAVDGKKDEFLTDPTGAGRKKNFFVPQGLLHDMSLLPKPET